MISLSAPSLDPAVRDLSRLFINRADLYLGWREAWRTVRRPLSPLLLDTGLKLPIGLGAAAVSGTGTSRWTCWDVDADVQIPRLIELYLGLPAGARLFEPSRRGGHVWFFHQPVAWQTARADGRERAARAGLAPVEVFPKHGGINCVRLPGMVHPKTGERHPVIDPVSGVVLDFRQALKEIVPAGMAGEPRAIEPARGVRTPTETKEFGDLVGALRHITRIWEYAPGRANGMCPWHHDERPSLFVAGKRFHCLACGVWGDVQDVYRWRERGVRPPSK